LYLSNTLLLIGSWLAKDRLDDSQTLRYILNENVTVTPEKTPSLDSFLEKTNEADNNKNSTTLFFAPFLSKEIFSICGNTK
jgi:hypothetical protein